MKDVVWLDIETTGLDENYHSLLSVGAVKYDDNWQNRQEFHKLVYVPQPDKLLWSPVALDMHRKSGLYTKIQTPPNPSEARYNSGTTLPVDELEQLLISWASQGQGLAHKPFILAGNSIQFDRKFIRKQLPFFETQLHYRMIDVSGMAMAFKLFGGVDVKWPDYSHEALKDADGSIELLKACMSHLKS